MNQTKPNQTDGEANCKKTLSDSKNTLKLAYNNNIDILFHTQSTHYDENIVHKQSRKYDENN